MFPRTWSLLSLLPFCHAFPQNFAYLEALQQFATSFTNPQEVINGGMGSLLSEDVVGRIDVTTTLVGQELNSEYLFGLFLEGSLQNTTQLIGTPTTSIIQEVAIEPPVVSVSFITGIYYKTIDTKVPLQIDMFIHWDGNMNIVSYDATMRGWTELFDYVTPSLAAQIATEFGETYNSSSNDTSLIVRRAITDICTVAMDECTGDNQQYDSYDDCYNLLSTKSFGPLYAGGFDTSFCRYVHKNMVVYRPDVHCPHIGPSGGDMCIARDYVQIVDTVPFNETLLAYNASYNTEDDKGLSEDTLLELYRFDSQKIKMSTIAVYSISNVLYFLILYFAAKFTELGMYRTSQVFRDLSFTHQRTTVSYIISTVVTTAAFILQLIASPLLVKEYTFQRLQEIMMVSLLVSGLYIFEMIYRRSLRKTMLLHHLCTLLAILLLLGVLDETEHPTLAGAGYIWLLQATTEQSIFIGMTMYRLKFNPRLTQRVLRFAAVQSLIVKMAFVVYLFVWWGINLAHNHTYAVDIVFSVLLVIICVLLMTTQVYGSWAVWAVSMKLSSPKPGDPKLTDDKPRDDFGGGFGDEIYTHRVSLGTFNPYSEPQLPADDRPIGLPLESSNTLVDG